MISMDRYFSNLLKENKLDNCIYLCIITLFFNRFMKFPNFPRLKNYRFGVPTYILNEWEMWKIWDFMCLYIK